MVEGPSTNPKVSPVSNGLLPPVLRVVTLRPDVSIGLLNFDEPISSRNPSVNVSSASEELLSLGPPSEDVSSSSVESFSLSSSSAESFSLSLTSLDASSSSEL